MQLQLMSQAYSQYLAGMTSSWQVLRELRRCPKFLTFIQVSEVLIVFVMRCGIMK